MAVKPQTANPNPNPSGDGNRNGKSSNPAGDGDRHGKRLTGKKFPTVEGKGKPAVFAAKAPQKKSGDGDGITANKIPVVRKGKGITAKKITNQPNSDLIQPARVRRYTSDKEFGKFEPRNSFITKREGFQVKKITDLIHSAGLRHCNKEFGKSETRNSFITKKEGFQVNKFRAVKIPVVKNSSVGKEKTAGKPSSEKKSGKSPITRVKKNLNQQTSDLIHPVGRRGCTSESELEELELSIEHEMQRARLAMVMQKVHFLQLKSQWKAARASKLALRKSTEAKPLNKKIITGDVTTEKSSNIGFRLRKKKPIIIRRSGEKGDGLDDHGTDRTKRGGGGCSQRTTFQKRRRSLVPNFDNDEDPSCSRKKKERKEEEASDHEEDPSWARMASKRKDGASGNRVD